MPAAPGPPGPPGPPVQPTPSIQPTGQLTVGRGRVKVIVVDPATKMARVKIDKEYFNVSLDKLNTSSTDMEDVAQRVVLIIDQLLLGEVHDAGGDCTHQGIFDPTTTASLVLRGPIPSVPTTGGTSSTEPRPVLVSNFNLIEITDTGTTTPPRSGTLKMGNPGTATAFKVIAVFGAVVASPAAEAAVHPASTARPPAGQQPLLSSSAASGQIAPAAAPGQGGQGGGTPAASAASQKTPSLLQQPPGSSTSGTPAPVQQQQQQPAPEPVAHPPAPLLPLSSSSAAAAAPSQAPIAPAQTGEERYQPPGLQHTSAPNPLTADPPPAPAQGLNLFSRNVSASDLVMGREKKTGTLLYKDSTEAPTSGSTAAPGLPLQQPAGGPPPASTAHRSPAGRMGGTGGGGGGPPLPLAPAQPPGPAGGQASATVPPELAAAAGGQVGGTPVAAASASVLPFDQQQRRAPPPPSVTAAAAPDSATSEVPGPGGGTPAAHPAAPEPAPLPLPQQQPLASAAALTPGGGGTPAPAPVTELEPPPPVPPATVPPVALTPEGVGSLTSGSVLPPAAASAAARGPATVQQLRAEIQTLFFQLIPDLSKLEGAEKTSLDRLISKTGRGAQEMGVEALIDTIQGKEDLKEKLKIIWTIIKAAHPTATPAEAIQLLRTGIEIAQTSAALRTKTRPSWANLLIPVPRSHSQTIIRKDSKAEELAAANTMYNALMSLQLEQQPPVTAASAAAAPAPPPQETAQRRDSVSEASPPLTLTASSPEAAAPTAAAGAAAALPQTPLLPLSSSSAASEPAPTIQTLTAGIQNLFFQLIPDLSKLKGPVLSKLEGAEKTSLDRLISKTGPTAKAMGIEALIDMIEGKEELKGKLKTIWTIIKAAHPTANPAEAIQLLRTGIEIAQTSADKRTTRKHLWANLLTPVPPSNSGTKGKEAKLKAELAELAAADAMYKALYELKTSQATAAHVPPALPPPPQQQQQPVSAAAAAASTPAPGGGTPAASAAPRQGQGGGGGPTSAHVAPAAAALPPLPPGSGQQHTSAPAPGHVAPVTAPTPAPVLSAAAAPSAAASPPAASASGPAAAGGMGGGQASATPTALEASALAAEALVTAVAPAPTRPLSETPPLPIAPEHLQQTAQTRDSVPEVPPLLPQSPQYSTGTGSSLSPPPTPLPGEQTPTALGDQQNLPPSVPSQAPTSAAASPYEAAELEVRSPLQHRVEVLASTLTDAIAELFKRSNEAGYPNTQQAKEKLEEARVAIPYIIAYSTAAAATADLPTQAKSVLSLINKAADLMGIKQSESLNRAIKNLAAIPLTALATPLPSQLPNIQQATLDLESALSEAGRFLLASPTQSSPTTGATEPRATTAPKFVRGTHSNLGGRGRCADLSLAHQLLRRREGQVIRPETLTSIADNLREDVITKIRDPSFHSIENNRVRIRQDLNTIKAAGSLTSQKISSTLLAFSLNIQDLSGPIPVDIQQGLRVTLSGCRQPKKIFNIPNNQGNTDPFIALSYEIYKKIHGKEPESTLDLKKFGTNFINNSSDFKGDRLSTLRSAIQALKDRAERETSRISAILSKRVSETTTPELVAIYTDLLEYDPEAQSDETYFQALVEARSQPASEPYNIMIVDDADPSIKDRGLYQITQVIKPENSSDFNDINSQNNLFIWYDRPQGHYHSFIPAENAPSGGQRQSLPQPGSPSPSGNLVGGPRQALPPTPPSASAGAPPPQTSAHGSKLPEVTMAGTISEARRLVNETYGREGGLFGPDAKPSERKQTTAPIAPVPKAPTRDPLRVEQGSDQDPLKPQPALPPAPPSASSAFASSAAEQIGTAGPLPISPQDVASPSSSRTPGVPTPGQRPMSILEDIRQTLSDIIPDFSEEETTLLADLPGHFSKDITRIPPEAPIQENISQLRQIIEKLYPYSRELYDSQPEYKKEIERLLEGAIIVLLDEEKDGLVNHLSTPLTINHITGSRSQDTTLEFILEAVHELRAEAAAAALAALEPPPASSKSPVTSLPHPSPGSDTPTRARLPAERVQPQAGVSQSGILPVADGGSPLSPSSPPQNMPQTSAEAVPEARARLPSQERVRSASTETPHSGLETGTLGGSSPLSTGSEPRLSTEQTRADEADLQSLQRELDAEDSLEDVEREIKSSLNALTPDFNPDEFAHLKALSRPPLEMPRYTPEGFSEKIAELRNIIQKLSPYSETQHGTQEEYEEFIAKVFQKAISVYVTAKQHENKNELVNYLQLIGFKGVAELPTQIEGARLIQSTLDQLQSQQLDEGLKSSEFVPQADEEDLLTELAELTDSDKAVSSSAKPISTSPVAGTPPPTAAAKIATTASTQLPVTGSPPLSRRRDTPTQPSPLSTVPAKPVPKKEPPLPPPSVTAARARATRPAAAASSAASAASTPLELLRKEQVRVINILARPIDLHGVLREIGTTNLDLIQLTTIIPKLRDLTDAQKRQARENLQLLIVDRNAKAGLAEATIQELSSQELQKINTVRLPTSTRKLNFLMPLLYPKLPSVDEAAHADQFKAIVEAATKFLIAGKISELTGFLHTVPNLATKSLTPLERYKALGSITAMLIKRGAL